MCGESLLEFTPVYHAPHSHGLFILFLLLVFFFLIKLTHVTERDTKLLFVWLEGTGERERLEVLNSEH